MRKYHFVGKQIYSSIGYRISSLRFVPYSEPVMEIIESFVGILVFGVRKAKKTNTNFETKEAAMILKNRAKRAESVAAKTVLPKDLSKT